MSALPRIPPPPRARLESGIQALTPAKAPRLPPPLPQATSSTRAVPPPLPAVPPAAEAPPPIPAWATVAPPLPPPPVRQAADDIPDFLNGAVRRRRAGWIVVAVAALAVIAAFAAAIASHYQPN